MHQNAFGLGTVMREFLFVLAVAMVTLSAMPILFVLLPMFIYWDVGVVSAPYIRGCIAAWLISSVFASVCFLVEVHRT